MRYLWLIPATIVAVIVGVEVWDLFPKDWRPTANPVNANNDPVALKGLPAGVEYLNKQQSDDGAYRSDVYATFKDGTALTPLVLVALNNAADAGDPTDTAAARKKAAAWLANFARPDGTIDAGDGLKYPVYTAALSVIALSHPENAEHWRARDAWLKFLLDRQLTEQNGWKPEDKQYGGWGYYPKVPKKPAAGEAVPAQHLLESNLSATAFALDALAAAGRRDDLVLRNAGVFVERCRNEDGGFHFIYDDPVRNKAGTSDAERTEFHSYGSATADGRRALELTNTIRGKPAGVNVTWIEKHFTPDQHPGTYVPTHERNRNAVYFYYAASVAKTFRLLGVTEANGQKWADTLSTALLAKQRPDGSWQNDADQQRENDPVLATAYAVQALARCRN